MRTPWWVLGGGLLGFALTAPGVSGVERVVAIAVAAAVFVRPSKGGRLFLALGLALGCVAGGRLLLRWNDLRVWDGYEGWAHVEVLYDIGEDEVVARIGTAHRFPTVARLRVPPDRPSGGGRWVSSIRLAPLRGPRNPDDRDPHRSRLAQRTSVGGRVLEIAAVRDGPSRTANLAVREVIGTWLDQRLGEVSGLWRALILADASALGEEQRRKVQELGLAHLLALSGLHVGIVLAAVLWPFRSRLRTALPVALPLLFLWLWLAGAGPSLSRAVLMVALVAWGKQRRRVTRVEDALAVAALLELTWRPTMLGSLGWWLSHSATLGILRAGPVLRERPWWLGVVGIGVVAHVATGPWVVDAFGRVPLLAPLLQIVFGPLFAVLLIVGMALLAVAAVAPASAPIVVPVVQFLSHAFAWTVAWCHSRFSVAFHHPGIPDFAWAVALLTMGVLLWPGGWSPRRRGGVALSLIVLVHLFPRATHEWISFDVGQGDAGLYRCGDRFLLVDAGPAAPGYTPVDRSVRSYLLRRQPRDVRLLLTHGHRDHTGGAASLLATGRIGEVLIARSDVTEPWVRSIAIACSIAGAGVRFVGAGDSLRLGHCSVPVLWPPAALETHEQNDRSIVLALGPPGARLFAGGDLERGMETRVAEALPPGAWSVLKVAHHGGNTGTDAGFLDALGAELAILSCGRGNRYGHPHPACVARLTAAGMTVVRTDREGAVRVVWRGSEGDWAWGTAAAAPGGWRP